MKQAERQARSKNEIFQAAVAEFKEAGYEAVSMERICLNHGISKGMMYHYYANKDELFLQCVQTIFMTLNEHIEQKMDELLCQDPFDAIKHYFLIREGFFALYPQYKLIFETAVIHPPKHLAEEIRMLHQPIMERNWYFINHVVKRMSLRDDLETEKVMRYLQSIEPVLLSIVRRYQAEQTSQDLHTILEAVQEVLHMMLFGILKQSETI